MNNDKFSSAMHRSTESIIPPPPQKCDGQLYTVEPNNTIFGIARRFGVTVDEILAANPQIVNPDTIFVGQVICIPNKPHQPVCDLRVLTVNFLTESGQPLPVIDGAVQLNATVIVRPTFNHPVSRAFFFLEPTGTEACEQARLIGVDCPSAVTGVAEIIWRVPLGTLGRVFVVACINICWAKSDEILVVRNS